MNLETIKQGLKYYKKNSVEGTEFRDVCIIAENLIKELEEQQLLLNSVVKPLKYKRTPSFKEWSEDNKYTKIATDLYKKGKTYKNIDSLYSDYLKNRNL